MGFLTPRLGRHIGGQLVRCGTAAAPNYEEACAAESRADFIHKLRTRLKELRESRSWLRLILKAIYYLSIESRICSMNAGNCVMCWVSQWPRLAPMQRNPEVLQFAICNLQVAICNSSSRTTASAVSL
jgi:hypothetical protein